MAELWLNYIWTIAELWLNYGWTMAELWLNYGWTIAELWLSYSWTIAELWLNYGWTIATLTSLAQRKKISSLVLHRARDSRPHEAQTKNTPGCCSRVKFRVTWRGSCSNLVKKQFFWPSNWCYSFPDLNKLFTRFQCPIFIAPGCIECVDNLFWFSSFEQAHPSYLRNLIYPYIQILIRSIFYWYYYNRYYPIQYIHIDRYIDIIRKISADPSRMLGERAGEECAGDRDRLTDRDRQTETDRQRQTDRDRQTETDRRRQRQRERQRDRDRERDRERERERDRETERQRDRETERQRDRETERRRDGETERRRDGETERRRDGETERRRDGETERQRDGETERQRDGETDRQTGFGRGHLHFSWFFSRVRKQR